MKRQIIKWFYPGMHVKRWILVLALGVLIASGGLWLLVGINFLGAMEGMVIRVLLRITGGLPSYTGAFAGALLVVVGVALIAMGFRQTAHTLLAELAPSDADHAADIIFVRRQLRRGPHVVAIGGGTGLPSLLRGLKEYTSNITAIVTVADDGGSSGRLREDFGILPPGDIRNTLVALADTEPLMEALFQYRFTNGSGLAGHSFGNLFITAMNEIAGDFEQAVRQSSRVLAIRGRVLPSTLESVVLRAEYTDGTAMEGESRIPQVGKRIRRVCLSPQDAQPVEDALQAIDAADIILVGPGSLFTSVIPSLLVGSISERVRSARALKIFVCNVMTQPGETDGFTAADHLQALIDHVGPGLVDYCLVNRAQVPEELVRRHREQGAFAVQVDAARLRELGATPIARPLLSENDLARHCPAQLAAAVMEILSQTRRSRSGLRALLP